MDGHILAWTSATKAIKSNLHCLLTKALLLASNLQPSQPPHTHPTLTAGLTPAMPSTEAIGNKDNYIKQPFEIPLGLVGWCFLVRLWEMREVWFIALPLVMDRMTSHHPGRDCCLSSGGLLSDHFQMLNITEWCCSPVHVWHSKL